MTVIRKMISFVAGWRGYVLLATACLSLGFWSGWTVNGWRAAADDAAGAKAQTRAATAVVAKTQEAARITEDVGREVEEAREVVRIVTRDLIKEVPVYVPVEVDRQFSVPAGFVRLHDLAAAGDAEAAFPDGPGQPADAPSGVALSAVAATVVDNYGTCHGLRAQVIGWQSWYWAQRKAWDAPAGG